MPQDFDHLIKHYIVVGMEQQIGKIPDSVQPKYFSSIHVNQQNQKSENASFLLSIIDSSFKNNSSSACQSSIKLSFENEQFDSKVSSFIAQKIKNSSMISLIFLRQRQDSVKPFEGIGYQNVLQQSYQMSSKLLQHIQNFNHYRLRINQLRSRLDDSKGKILIEGISLEAQLGEAEEKGTQSQNYHQSQNQNEIKLQQANQHSQQISCTSQGEIILQGVNLWESLFKYAMSLEQELNSLKRKLKIGHEQVKPLLNEKLEQKQIQIENLHQQISSLKQTALKQQNFISILKTSLLNYQKQSDQLKVLFHTQFSNVQSQFLNHQIHA